MGRTLYIVKTGDTFDAIVQTLQDFEQWISAGLSDAVNTAQIQVLHAQYLPDLPATEHIAAVIITGSHAMVSERAAWSERLVPWLNDLLTQQIPVLGICFGHQLIAHALGGRVGYHPQGIEIGTHCIELLPTVYNDPLFSAMPPTFPAQLVHRQTVLELPTEAVLLARGQHEPHQAFRIGSCCWGVQFHPEFSPDVMQAYIGIMTDDLQAEGLDTLALMNKCSPTPERSRLLMQFAALAAKRL